MNDRTYTLFVGVNGVGKTSLYRVLSSQDNLGERVNIDEIASGIGSWRDAFVQIRAARHAMSLIREYTDAGTSFHQETTVPGPTLLRQVKTARKRGFTVRMYFIGVEDVNIAISRVRRRVEKGGHGVDETVIEERYRKITEYLPQLLPLCDVVLFYDNTQRFRQIAVMQNGALTDRETYTPSWFSVRIMPIIRDLEEKKRSGTFPVN